jgi:hypothetical protein
MCLKSFFFHRYLSADLTAFKDKDLFYRGIWRAHTMNYIIICDVLIKNCI